MEREIKFRAWNKTHNYMDTEFCIHADGHLYQDAQNTYDTPNEEIESAYEELVVMQFTGLFDQNGTEIYEGDIMRMLYPDWPSQTDYSISLEEYIKSISSIGVVIFNLDLGCFNVKFGLDKYGSEELGDFRVGRHGHKEVIGNIYENPELLEDM